MPASVCLTSCLGPLCKIKLRLLINMLFKRFGAAKLFFLSAFALFTAYVVKSISLDMLNFLTIAAVPNELIEWLLGIYCFYLILIVFAGDLITGHTLDTGSLSSDYDYLTTLPIPYFSLTLCKVFERLIADYLGVVLLLASILGIACRKEIALGVAMASFMLYFIIGIVSGCLINLVLLVLKKVLPISTVNNLFSIAGYMLVIFSVVPFIVINQASSWVVKIAVSYYYSNQNKLIYTILRPIKLLGEFLYQPGFTKSFWLFFAFCLGALCISFAALYFAVKGNTPGSVISTRHKNTFRRGLFSSFVKKDFLLIKNDFNILMNAFLLPISIVLINVFVLKSTMKADLTPAIALNLIYGAIIYFCMFGPCNAVGAEGKAFSLIENMGVTLSSFFRQKFIFWYAAAASIFVPTTAVSMLYVPFQGRVVIASSIKVAFFIAFCVWVAVRFSAIFARYDRKVLQQSSEFYAKFFILFMALVAAPLKEFSLINAYTAIIAIVLCRLIDMKAKYCLFYRNDADTLNKVMPKHINFWLLIFSFLGAEICIKQFVLAVVGLRTGLWSWAIALVITLLVSMFFEPFAALKPRRPSSEAISELVKCILCGSFLGLFFHYCLADKLPGFDSLEASAMALAEAIITDCQGILVVDLFIFLFVAVIVRLVIKQLLTDNGSFLSLRHFALVLALPLVLPIQAAILGVFLSAAACIIRPTGLASTFALVSLSLSGVFM